MGAHRVLVVDDDVGVGALMVRVLAAGGHEVRCVGSAEEALVALEDFLPDVMCVDLMLPGMDGGALAREVRARLHDHAPCMMLVSATPERLSEADEALFEVLLVKPFRLDELRARVDGLGRRAAARRRRSGQRFHAVTGAAGAAGRPEDGEPEESAG